MPAPVEDIENALSVEIASAVNLPVPECRRLTGPGLLWDRPGAVLDVFYHDMEYKRVGELWEEQARRILDAVGWPQEQSIARQFTGGCNLAISAPMDQLYSAVFVAETAWHFCAAALLQRPSQDFSAMVIALKKVMAMETNPALTALLDNAKKVGVDALCDDDEVSMGYGIGSQTWQANNLPAVGNVNWPELHDIPLALITGTNGKTTTTRLCAAIARSSGKVSGLTSTDLVRVGDDVIERGDFSGPGGARLLLRDKRLEIGVLEVARGGILRRGLAVRHAQVAAVLNVAADHLGDYGVNTVAELAEAKFAVHRALVPHGVLVLNADDPYVVAQAARTSGQLCWFSLDAHSPQVIDARTNGNNCAWLEADALVYFDGAQTIRLAAANQIPITMNGRARYNILNALAAVCVCRALGIDSESIRKGLVEFQNNTSDNPGRLNEFKIKGAKVFVDFAHNPHSIAAVTGALGTLEAKRRIVMISNAGDRSNEAIRELTRGAFALKPDFIMTAELPDYLRGRALGEVSRVINEECIALGMSEAHILQSASPSAGTAAILNMIEPNDLVLLLVHSQRDTIFEMLTLASTDTQNW